jgi:MFS family permease
MGVIFLTLYIDLIGFSIIFPLLPDLLKHYLDSDGHGGLLGAMVAGSENIAHFLGKDSHYGAVLFGGLVSSLFSILQFLFSPFWGGLSDRIGRRPVLLWTVAGTALGYVAWMLSGSFWIFVLSRVICGAFGGNLSVATAAVADVTTREDRSKAMGLVGAAFGLGLVTGPGLGALAVHFNPIEKFPVLASWGFNPFSLPAALSLAMSVVNLVWISSKFRETLDPEHKGGTEPQRNAFSAIFSIQNGPVRSANLVAFVFSVAFVAMEMTLTFLAADRFGYTASQNGLLLVFMGVCSIVTQGVIVRRLLKTMNENSVLVAGLALSAIGLVGIGFSSHAWMIYVALVFSSLGSGLVNPSTTGLISLYSSPSEQGRVLGVFRSLGALSRAITPLLAGIIYWSFGSLSLYLGSALLAVGALILARRLPKPAK